MYQSNPHLFASVTIYLSFKFLFGFQSATINEINEIYAENQLMNYYLECEKLDTN